VGGSLAIAAALVLAVQIGRLYRHAEQGPAQVLIKVSPSGEGAALQAGDIARPLSLRTGDAVLQLRRVLAFQGTPTILEDVWLPGGPFKGLTAERLATHRGPMYALFETEFGVRMVRAEEKIRAVAADEASAALLNVPVGAPLLSVERTAYTYNDLPMELRRGLYRTDTHHYKNDLS
jgi:GntR family transcriptional regulator